MGRSRRKCRPARHIRGWLRDARGGNDSKMVARRGRLPDLPAQLRSTPTATASAICRASSQARLCRQPRRGRDLDLAVLQVADGGLRLRRRRLPRGRPAVRHAGGLRRAARRGARAGPEGDHRPGAEPLPRTQHAWFQESRESRDNPKADWYVWADAKPDGTPPNNWLSLFGGWRLAVGAAPRPVLPAQLPGLASPTSISTIRPCRRRSWTTSRFWLDRGVDGFRLDAINFCFHDAAAARQPAEAAGTAHRARVQPRQSVCVPVPLLQQHAAGEPRVPRASACVAGPLSGHRRARRDLIRGFAGDHRRILATTNACTWATASSC